MIITIIYIHYTYQNVNINLNIIKEVTLIKE